MHAFGQAERVCVLMGAAVLCTGNVLEIVEDPHPNTTCLGGYWIRCAGENPDLFPSCNPQCMVRVSAQANLVLSLPVAYALIGFCEAPCVVVHAATYHKYPLQRSHLNCVNRAYFLPVTCCC